MNLGSLGEILSAAAESQVKGISKPVEGRKEQAVPAGAHSQTEQQFAALPRHRSLTDPNARMLTKLRAWLLRKLAPRDRRTPSSAARNSIEHLQSLQSDLAAIQRRIERMIAGARN